MFHLKRHVLDICRWWWWWWWWSHLKRRHILNIGGVVKRVVASWVLPAIAFIAVDFRPSCTRFYDEMRIKTHTCTPWPSWCSTARAQEPAPYENLRVSNIFMDIQRYRGCWVNTVDICSHVSRILNSSIPHLCAQPSFSSRTLTLHSHSARPTHEIRLPPSFAKDPKALNFPVVWPPKSQRRWQRSEPPS